jgi:hypothetical protein
VEWLEAEYYHWLTQLIKLLQKFDMHDVIPMKSEVANVFNWYTNFVKYVESMKMLKYPTYFNKRKKSSEIMDLDRMSSTVLSAKKTSNDLKNPIHSFNQSAIINLQLITPEINTLLSSNMDSSLKTFSPNMV